MNLSLAEITELPLAAALIDSIGDVIARTPEWDGPGPGAVSYPVRSVRLVVRTQPASALCDQLLTLLLDSIDCAAHTLSGTQAQRVRMLGCSLRLVAGRDPGGWGTTDDVIDHARAGITARTGLTVETSAGPARPVLGPEIAALVLVQLAVNAERHDAATAVRIEVDRTTFRVVWRHAGPTPRVTTARRRAERERWGLGFARIAADAIGGTVYPPAPPATAPVAATLELGIRRLALPLAAVRDGRVYRATRSWDEETGLAPGSGAGADSKLATIRPPPHRFPGGSSSMPASARGWDFERSGLPCRRTSSSVRAREVVTGLVHERALSDHIPEPATITHRRARAPPRTLLGEPMPRVPMAAWTRRMVELGPAFGLGGHSPRVRRRRGDRPAGGRCARAVQASGFEIDGDRLWLRVRDECRDDAAVRVLLRPGESRIPLG